ncbi:MAG TPA: replication initiator protein A [Acidobacteriota bacterium]|nr:replication initiator protein A [Acidobacteriota bacterium]
MGFVAIEKNLASLGYFSPSNKRVRMQSTKTVTFTKILDGKRLQAKATIIPGTTFGLPTTADQDKYIAFQKIVVDSKQRHCEVRNPIAFSSAELLDLLGQCRNSGGNYEHIDEWLNVMNATTIISEGMICLDGRPIWSKDRFRVFDQVASIGSELEGGRRADKNYVWLSRWQLENINKNHLLPIELESYLKLKNHIARALVPHLQIWLYASRNACAFEKRYDELCQVLNLNPYSHASKIKEKLGPSLDELVEHGYLAGWDLDVTSGHAGHKIIFHHGEKFRGDQRKTIASQPNPQGFQILRREEQKLNPSLVEELVRRNIPERQAKKLLANIAEGQEVLDQLEWGDYWIRQNLGSKIFNPPGFYIYLIKENIHPPELFETSRKQAIFYKQKQAREQEIEMRAALEFAYEDYRDQILESYIAENYPGEKYSALIERKKQELSPQYRQYTFWKPGALTKFLETSVRADLEKGLSLQTFDAFCKKRNLTELTF